MKTASARLSGHPDQACELVAEAIIDEYIRRDPSARVKLAVTGGRGVLFIVGDVLSQADFDVSAVAKRTLGSIGVADDLEVFVSLENVPSERVAAVKLLPESPLTVCGYASAETECGLPLAKDLAKRMAKKLEEKRRHDPEWYWLGPDAEIVVVGDNKKLLRAVVLLEHGDKPLEEVRASAGKELAELEEDLSVEINLAGPVASRGLGKAVGMSGNTPAVYGSFLPHLPNISGRSPLHPEKAGAWLARAAALKILRSGMQAVLVQATYFPGETAPRFFSARDEQGKNCSHLITREELDVQRVMSEWWRPNLNFDAARWGFAGEPDLPWEDG
ncbi:MAG: S-adenosylmethionine synthetase N-terminal domain-containing protein [Patescibacteria group bacterium]